MLLNELLAEFFGPYVATVLGFALALFLFAHVLRGQQRQSASLAWLLAFVVAPVVFVPLYLIFAGRKVAARARRKRHLQLHATHKRVQLDGLSADIEKILNGYELPMARTGNQIELITSGEHGYKELVSLIDSAEHTIHIATFILARDEVGRDIVQRLAARAQQGVEVRLLVDALGSLGARFTLLKILERAGGHTGVFMRMIAFRRRWKADLRNHRKLAIFDGTTVLTGGMNIGREYMGPTTSSERWIDTMIKVSGPVVYDLAGVFADDWEFATGEHLTELDVVAAPHPTSQAAQAVPSGPDVDHDGLYDAIVASVYKARKRVWLVTPYFLPDSGLARALLMQAQIGTDVQIVLPRSSDQWLPDMARARTVRELHAAGARFHLHPRMVHAKQFLFDEALSVQGSANMDMRSLYLNYELAVFCYDDGTIKATARWIKTLIDECEEYVGDEPNVIRRAVEDFCWLASPQL